MMRIVNLIAQKIKRSEGKCIHSVQVILPRSGKSELGPKIQENIGSLGNDEVAVLEEGRGEIRRVSMLSAA